MIHAAVDVEKWILSLKVTSEQVHEGKLLPELIDEIPIKHIKKINIAIANG